MRPVQLQRIEIALMAAALWTAGAKAQLIDRTVNPNAAGVGINKSYTEEIGAGRGDWSTPNSSSFIIARDPFRAIRRGRQLFQRKFTFAEGVGPRPSDGNGDIQINNALGAGLSDSCAGCHGRPKGSAGFGGNNNSRPDSRDTPQLFGLGLREMLGDEITTDLRAIRTQAIAQAQLGVTNVAKRLQSKGIDYGWIIAHPDGTLDTSGVRGVNPDLRVRPFFAHGGLFGVRQVVIDPMAHELGLQAVDPDLATASAGGKVVTPSGMVYDGSLDTVAPPPTADPTADPDGDGVTNEAPASIVDYFEFYLLNYFRPAVYEQTERTALGRKTFEQIGCASCHIPDLPLQHDRRVADVDTSFNTVRGNFNGLFATVMPLFKTIDDGSGLPSLKQPLGGSFVVQGIYTDFKRHDLGPNFHERNFDGTMQTQFMTTPLWGVGSTAPYGHDGRSINLAEVILRHGGEAFDSAQRFDRLEGDQRAAVLEFLGSLVLFPPDDTASNLDPGNRADPNFPQSGHGSIKLTGLFNDPNDPE